MTSPAAGGCDQTGGTEIVAPNLPCGQSMMDGLRCRPREPKDPPVNRRADIIDTNLLICGPDNPGGRFRPPDRAIAGTARRRWVHPGGAGPGVRGGSAGEPGDP